MPEIKCPDCRETMEIERDWYGRLLSCPSCKFKFTPKDSKSRPSRNDARSKSDKIRLKLILGIIGSVFLVIICLCGFGIYKFFAPIKYTDPWVSQSLPDGSASIQFPKTPISKSLDKPDGSFKGTELTFDESLPMNIQFAVLCFDYPPGNEAALDTLIASTKDKIKKKSESVIALDSTFPAYGTSVRQVEFQKGISPMTIRFVKVNDEKKSRLLTLIVEGRNVDDDDKKKFFDSFQLIAGKK